MLEGAEAFTQALLVFALIIMMILYLAPGILVALAAGGVRGAGGARRPDRRA